MKRSCRSRFLRCTVLIQVEQNASTCSTLEDPRKQRAPKPNLISIHIPNECERPDREFMEETYLRQCRRPYEDTTSAMLEMDVPFPHLEWTNGLIVCPNRVERDTEP